MPIKKSTGVTATERLLAELCEKSFLKLWSYPNPFKEDGNELCDLLAVFESNVFIFFDRENLQFEKSNKDPLLSWQRWKKTVIDKQIRTAIGTERYIKSGRGIYLDNKLEIPFPLNISADNIKIHKVVIAHGAKEACENFSEGNVYGSLGIVYGDIQTALPFPFVIHLDKENPIHVFDSHNLPIVFGELDTVFDFTSYLNAKVEAIKSVDTFVYCGEEDLLANYFCNFDESKNRHFIGTKDKDFDLVYIGEGEWKDFIELEVYKNKKEADKISYFWDELIQKTCQNALDETLLGNSDPFKGESPILEMAKEPRFFRRELSAHILNSIKNFPETDSPIMRNVSFMPSFYKGTGYVFLQLKVKEITDYEGEYRPRRRAILEIACGAAKNCFPHLEKIIGIAIDAPKYAKKNSEDFILMKCADWTDDSRVKYEKANEGLGFFQSKGLTTHMKKGVEFPPIQNAIAVPAKKSKVGRNDRCPCGSGKKYKKCCGNN